MVLATLSKITKVLNWLIVNSLGEYCSILSKINVKTFYSKLLSQVHVDLKLLLINKKNAEHKHLFFISLFIVRTAQ